MLTDTLTEKTPEQPQERISSEITEYGDRRTAKKPGFCVLSNRNYPAKQRLVYTEYGWAIEDATTQQGLDMIEASLQRLEDCLCHTYGNSYRRLVHEELRIRAPFVLPKMPAVTLQTYLWWVESAIQRIRESASAHEFTVDSWLYLFENLRPFGRNYLTMLAKSPNTVDRLAASLNENLTVDEMRRLTGDENPVIVRIATSRLAKAEATTDTTAGAK